MALVVELVTSVALQVRDVRACSEYCENYREISLSPLCRWPSAASPSVWRSGPSWSPATAASRPPPLGWGQQSWQPSRYHRKRCLTKIHNFTHRKNIYYDSLCPCRSCCWWCCCGRARCCCWCCSPPSTCTSTPPSTPRSNVTCHE